jgi:hypothetical protein
MVALVVLMVESQSYHFMEQVWEAVTVLKQAHLISMLLGLELLLIFPMQLEQVEQAHTLLARP